MATVSQMSRFILLSYLVLHVRISTAFNPPIIKSLSPSHDLLRTPTLLFSAVEDSCISVKRALSKSIKAEDFAEVDEQVCLMSGVELDLRSPSC